jgi:hypothetical protein
MGQITEGFARQMLVHCERKEHPPLTVWEAEQLARAWIDRERMRIGHDRYEIVRRMHVPMFKDAVQLSIRTGKPFDQIIDELKPFAPT